MTIQQKIISQLLARFPNTPSRKLARIALRQNREGFKDLAAAQTAVRRMRAASGRKVRSECADKKPLFEQRARLTLERCTSTFAGRGKEYGDTWRDCPFLAVKAVARALGDKIAPDHCRAIATAVLVDLKYVRMLGGYKDDNLVDGINYAAFLAEEMRGLLAGTSGMPRIR